MKKTILFLASLLIPFVMLSQSWISDNAVWHYGYFNLMEAGFDKIEYVSDTVIGGHQCEYLQVTRHRYYSTGGGWIPAGVNTLDPQFTYFSNDTVYYWNNSKFDILYYFGAQPGDNWSLGVDTNMLSCSESIVNVDSIGTIELNGEIYRWVSVSPEPNSSSYLSGKIVERFGAYETYLFPLMQCCDSNIIVEFDVFDFQCFEDDEFNLVKVGVDDCDNPLAVGIDEEVSPKIYIGPNPTNGYLLVNISDKETGTLSVYNSLGAEIESERITEEQLVIDLSGQPEGIYFLKYIGEECKTSTFKVIKK
jgi:hypothetical protein